MDRLTIAIAERLDNAADGDPNAVENPNNGGGGVGGEEEETTPTPPPKDGTTPEPPEKPEEEEPPVSKTSKAAVISKKITSHYRCGKGNIYFTIFYFFFAKSPNPAGDCPGHSAGRGVVQVLPAAEGDGERN